MPRKNTFQNPKYHWVRKRVRSTGRVKIKLDGTSTGKKSDVQVRRRNWYGLISKILVRKRNGYGLISKSLVRKRNGYGLISKSLVRKRNGYGLLQISDTKSVPQPYFGVWCRPSEGSQSRQKFYFLRNFVGTLNS